MGTVAGRAHFGKAGIVCVGGECHGVSDDVLNDVFLRCVFERDDVESRDHCSVLLEKPAFGATQACRLRTHAAPVFSNIQRLPVHMRDTRVSKVPSILRDWQELDAERAVF